MKCDLVLCNNSGGKRGKKRGGEERRVLLLLALLGGGLSAVQYCAGVQYKEEMREEGKERARNQCNEEG